MKVVTIIVLLLMSLPAYGWDGYDWERGDYIEIEDGAYVRPGEEVEIYHYETGEYHYETVESVSSDEVETYDYNTNEYKSYDMD